MLIRYIQDLLITALQSKQTMTKKKLSAREEIDLLNSKAERLAEVRKIIRTTEERFKQETDSVYAEEKELKSELLLGLKMVGLSSVKTTAGDSYFISRKNDFIIINPLEADKYARDERCVRIDKRILDQRLARALKEGQLPGFVKAEERETISVRSAKKED